MPEIDFSQYGDIETQPLTRINKLTGQFLHRNWVTVPHVTQFDEADITELEKFRKQLNEEHKNEGLRVTVLAFLMKALVSALKEYPRFNSSLDASGENLVLKKYIHIGVAVDTPDGLVVPVIRDCDRKSLIELANELIEASIKARDKKLSPADMSGGCISISSLGGIGGTAFTPIVNAPEVAILGVSRAQMKPVYKDGEFVPRLVLPLSLSYDHRVIDGADGARFTSFLSKVLSDTRRLLL
jgi:pyruvate dehydrogenase E2 component (dihydrolipoamide acetyltransferase)